MRTWFMVLLLALMPLRAWALADLSAASAVVAAGAHTTHVHCAHHNANAADPADPADRGATAAPTQPGQSPCADCPCCHGVAMQSQPLGLTPLLAPGYLAPAPAARFASADAQRLAKPPIL